METITTPLDFLGLNYYSRTVYHDPTSSGGRVLNVRDDTAVSARNWEIFPQGLYDLLTWVHKDYDLPKIVVTENGMALHDKIAADGGVHDPARIAFVKAHLDSILKAIDAGVNVRGYFCWTLLDNFEWAFGTLSRFGLAYTKFDTQERILKDSGRWYGQVARANAIVE
jgi:beta-glucosidase